jgi:hypothetical protein
MNDRRDGDRMFVTARTIAAEVGCSPKTVLANVRLMESEGYKVKAKIGRPALINRELFMRWAFPGWRDEEHEN